jgi:glucose-6-phosphate 1-epimerase
VLNRAPAAIATSRLASAARRTRGAKYTTIPSASSDSSSSEVNASAETLEKQHGIEGSVKFEQGRGSLAKAVLTHACGSSCEVYLYGANVLSWKQPSGDEVLYVRPDAKFDMTKAISGGIPLCFPQFGPGEMKQHGFARDSVWKVGSTSADYNPDDKDPCIELVLDDSEETRACGFPHPFRVSYSITLHRDILQTDFRVINTGETSFEFTAALHSYFEVAGIQNASVDGLSGLTYLDKIPDADNPARKEEAAKSVSFNGETDRVYLNAPNEVVLNVGTGAGVQIQNENWNDCVVWNPWTSMEACYKDFACVENAKASEKVKLEPNDTWRARADFSVVDLI